MMVAVSTTLPHACLIAKKAANVDKIRGGRVSSTVRLLWGPPRRSSTASLRQARRPLRRPAELAQVVDGAGSTTFLLEGSFTTSRTPSSNETFIPSTGPRPTDLRRRRVGAAKEIDRASATPTCFARTDAPERCAESRGLDGAARA